MNEKENFLLLHIGCPKTGTTSLQTFLWKNREELLKYGWDYPDFKNELHLLEDAYIAERGKNGDVLFERNFGNFNAYSPHVEQVIKNIKGRLEDHSVIISAEDIIMFRTEEILKLLKKNINRIKIIVYLRRQDMMAESCYNQFIKAYNLKEARSVLDYNFYAEWQLYGTRLNQISHIVGKENIIVRVYEKEQFSSIDGRRDTISDFMNLLGINSLEGFEETSNENDSIDGNFVEMRRLFNEARKMNSNSYDIMLRQFIDVAVPFQLKEKTGYMSLEERKKFLEYYRKENEHVAREYLGREDGRLFYDDNIDIPVFEPQLSSYDRDLTRMMAGLFFEQARQIRGLSARITCLELGQKLQTKYVFFGAGGRAKEAIEDYGIVPALILDNDKSKSGNKICGVEIKHPSEVREWKKYAIVVTPEKCINLEQWLKEEGLIKGTNYCTLNDVLYM